MATTSRLARNVEVKKLKGIFKANVTLDCARMDHRKAQVRMAVVHAADLAEHAADARTKLFGF